MILPEKHINMAESFFGFGGFLLQFLTDKITVDNLWKKFSESKNTFNFDAYHTFDDFILALDYLYFIGAINQNEKGEIFYEVNEPNCE